MGWLLYGPVSTRRERRESRASDCLASPGFTDMRGSWICHMSCMCRRLAANEPLVQWAMSANGEAQAQRPCVLHGARPASTHYTLATRAAHGARPICRPSALGSSAAPSPPSNLELHWNWNWSYELRELATGLGLGHRSQAPPRTTSRKPEAGAGGREPGDGGGGCPAAGAGTNPGTPPPAPPGERS
jgi:hypothetical protein